VQLALRFTLFIAVMTAMMFGLLALISVWVASAVVWLMIALLIERINPDLAVAVAPPELPSALDTWKPVLTVVRGIVRMTWRFCLPSYTGVEEDRYRNWR
jgi:hypothetical protein